ncbi:hypothetical protein J5893_04840 [bacterium]|nr:hypothetical protein [bacterium]
MCESPRAYCADGYARSGSACAPVVDGTCGAASGATYTSAPASDLCANDTIPSGVTTNTGTYTWTCAGLNGGSTGSCSAVRACAATSYLGYTIPQTNPGATTDLLSKSEVIT